MFDSGSIGDVTTWTVCAKDIAGNTSQRTCQINDQERMNRRSRFGVLRDG
jgi:hypothetical protein